MRVLRIVFQAFFSRQRQVSSRSAVVKQRLSRKRADFRVATTVVLERARKDPEYATIKGKCWVIDGDTIAIGEVRIRLFGIDAPELDHPWGQKSKWALVKLCKGRIITAHLHDDVSYDRVVATCRLPDGRDLAAELVKAGLALDWPRYSGGKYRDLEPPDARRKLWKANARQIRRVI